MRHVDFLRKIEAEGKQFLVGEIGGGLVECGLHVAGNGEEAWVAGHHRERARAGGSVVAEQKLAGLAVLGGDVGFDAGLARP